MVIPWNMHRKAMEQLYEGTCDIFQYQDVSEGHLSKMELAQTEEAVPCRLSFSASPAGNAHDGYTGVSQTIKLFLAPEVSVPAGSKVIVTQAGTVTAYRSSGQPAVYPSHQEIELTIWKERA